MMKTALVISLFVFTWFYSVGQDKIDVYLLPGQGADCRLFSQLSVDTNRFNMICLSYGIPKDDETMSSFAQRISRYIDTTNQFYLIGVSLGGMLATEMAHQLKPEKTIIISSAKSSKELPFRYTFQQKLPIYKVIPPPLLKKGALLLQPIVEPDRKKHKSTFISMLSNKSPEYFQSSISLIVNWSRTECTADILHIHGENDHTIPIRNISNPIVVENGSHMMTLTKAKKINIILSSIL